MSADVYLFFRMDERLVRDWLLHEAVGTSSKSGSWKG